MGRRKKRKPPRDGAEGESAKAPRAPERINRPFADALAGVEPGAPEGRSSMPPHTMPPPGPARPEHVPSSRPPPPGESGPGDGSGDGAPPAHSYEDRVAFSQAFTGVRPLPPRKGAGQRAAPDRPPGRMDPGPSKAAVPADPEADARARARLDALVAGGVRFKVEREEGFVQAVREGAAADALRGLRRRGLAPEAVLDLHGMAGDEAEREVGRFVRAHHRRGDRLLLVVHGKGHHSEGGMGVLGDRVARALTEGPAAPQVDAFVTAPARLGGSGAVLVALASK